MSTFHLRVVASNRTFFNGACESVTFQTTDGEVGFLAHHAPALVAVKSGEIRITKDDGEVVYAVVSDGIAETANNRMSIIVYSCERADEIDVARAREAEERAAERLRQKQSIVEYQLNKAAMARAMARLKEASKNSHAL